MMDTMQRLLKNQQNNYIFPFLWMHGESEETLREYMGAIESAGMGAVCVESRPHPDFMGERYGCHIGRSKEAPYEGLDSG